MAKQPSAGIERLKELESKLRAMAAKARKEDNVSVSVGYTAQYALWLHEMPLDNVKTLGKNVARPSKLGHYWGPFDYGPQWLLNTFREMSKQLSSQIIADRGSGRMTMAQALVRAGLMLERNANRRVPVEHGNLRASSFTRLDPAGTV